MLHPDDRESRSGRSSGPVSTRCSRWPGVFSPFVIARCSLSAEDRNESEPLGSQVYQERCVFNLGDNPKSKTVRFEPVFELAT